MGNNWIANELETVDLEDKRLNDRLAEILDSLSSRPNLSIPAACGGRPEMTAAYRFFDNDKTTFQKIIKPHYDATKKRIAEQQVVLCVQDTTELDLTRPEQQIQGAGPIGAGTNRRGAYLHLLEAFTPDGTPLGAVWSKEIIRTDEEQSQVTEKESVRWLEGYRETIKLANNAPDTKHVCIGDSESDIFEVLAEERAENVHLLVRMCQDRRVTANNDEISLIRKTVYASSVIGTKSLEIRGRKKAIPCAKGKREQNREERKTTLEIRKTELNICAPKPLQKKYGPVKMNAVVISEPNPPKDEHPIEWILLTTLPIDTFEDVLKVIEYYEVRWMIEVFFKTLKSGCKVEELQFEKMERLLPCLAVYVIVSWRVLMTCRIGRSHPDISCEIIFDASEWKSTHKILHPKKKLPQNPPCLGDMLKMVGELGGWVSQGKDDWPGPQTTWIGHQRVRDFALGWEMFGPDTRN